MPTHAVTFEVNDPATIDLPAHHLRAGGRYSVEVQDGDIHVFGNREGLLYLADLLAMLAVGGFKKGFHVHVPAESQALPGQEGPELALFAAEG